MSQNQNVQAMIQLAQQDPQILPLITRFLSLPDLEKRKWFRIMKQIESEPDFSELVELQSKITSDPISPTRTREDTLSRIKKYVETISKHDQMFPDSRTKRMIFRPRLKPHEMILVQFAGQGSEIHDLHYGIVWDVNDARDTVVVIPVSSFKYESARENGLRFNIGKVGFLFKETLVSMTDITSISRKRIHTKQVYNSVTKTFGTIQLEPEQVIRIQDGFRVLGLGEQTLGSLFINHKWIPMLSDLDVQTPHMHRPYTIEQNTTHDVLHYTVSGDTTVYQIERVKTRLSRAEKNKFLLKWLNATGTDAKMRKLNQERAYHNMIQLSR